VKSSARSLNRSRVPASASNPAPGQPVPRRAKRISATKGPAPSIRERNDEQPDEIQQRFDERPTFEHSYGFFVERLRALDEAAAGDPLTASISAGTAGGR
jgi:hypothetical protein